MLYLCELEVDMFPRTLLQSIAFVRQVRGVVHSDLVSVRGRGTRDYAWLCICPASL
jgi:hypothetical protein